MALLIHPCRWICLPLWPNPPFDPRWSAAQRGLWAERAAARRLFLSGWAIAAHRWKSAAGSDIDLIAANEHELLFLEVKYRAADDPNPWVEVFSPARRRLLRDAIGDYLRATRQQAVTFRVEAWLTTTAEGSQPAFTMREGSVRPQDVPGWRGIGRE